MQSDSTDAASADDASNDSDSSRTAGSCAEFNSAGFEDAGFRGAATISRDRPLVRNLVVGVVICLLIMGAVFRAQGVGDFLWLDEQHTAWVATTSLSHVASGAADGNQTPLFFYACWASVAAGGDSAVSLRLPSLLCGLALLVGVPWYVYRRTNDVLSLLLVSVWLAFNFDAVFYSSEARPYAMVQLIGAVQVAVFFGWVMGMFTGSGGRQSVTSGGVITALLTALIFYAHPTGMLLVVSELIFLAGLCLVRRRVLRRHVSALFASALLCGTLILPGIILISFVWQRRSNWTTVSNADEVFSKLASDAGMMMLFPIAVLLIDRTWRRGRQFAAAKNSSHDSAHLGQRFGWLLGLVGCWALVPRFLIASLDAAGWVSLAIDRYAIVGAVGFPLFASLAVASMRRDYFRWGTTIVIAAWILWGSQVNQQLRRGGFRHENWRQTVEMINAQDSELPVFLIANLIEDNAAVTDQSHRFQSYLRFPLTGIPKLNAPDRIIPRPSQGKILSHENLAQVVEQGGGFVVVRDAEVYRDAIRLEITAALQEHAQTQSARLFSAPVERPDPNNVHLFWIKLDSKQ